MYKGRLREQPPFNFAVLDNSGYAVVKYYYDAWGNHEIRDASVIIKNGIKKYS